ncbi:DUF3787 domain-containing protein [Clostridium sp. SYSU_GA19001]|uniref:CDIF630_02480 family spore surface protein n=1 Tax=Clostridium caldaquaticum TaxID=2940653 RepID=UPI00207758B2|nr:DUF3787 domain-containing protein [Clostridium caldaquaticum]MCM8711494.1 DUF3787 domain-containing protein [Clostridium caldaquaticum]
MKDTNYKEKLVSVPIEKHDTASWANVGNTKPLSNVSIPDETEVMNAKEFVDSNQK